MTAGRCPQLLRTCRHWDGELISGESRNIYIYQSGIFLMMVTGMRRTQQRVLEEYLTRSSRKPLSLSPVWDSFLRLEMLHTKSTQRRRFMINTKIKKVVILLMSFIPIFKRARTQKIFFFTFQFRQFKAIHFISIREKDWFQTLKSSLLWK